MENDMKELSGVKVHCDFEKAVDVVVIWSSTHATRTSTAFVRVKNRYLEKAINSIEKLLTNLILIMCL